MNSAHQINVGAMLLVLILGHFMTGILVVAYTAGRQKSKAINTLLLSKLLQTIAWILIGLRAFTPSMVPKIAGNAMLFAGAACELIALLILKNSFEKITKKAYLGLLFVCFATFIVVTALDTTDSTRIAAASLVAAVLMAYPVYVLYANRNSSFLQKTIASLYGVTVLFLLCRAYVSFTSDISLDLESTNPFNIGLMLLLYLVMFAGSVGFILLDKEKSDREILKAACYDDLTGILNRRTFILRAKEAVSLFARRQEPVSYLLIDLDDFKAINDRHGHYLGDAVLVHFADAIRNRLRDYDLFGRYGGEEFAVLLPGTGREESLEIAERLRTAIEASSVTDVPDIRYTVSIGAITVTPDRDTDVEALYRLSDSALYLAKLRGKNRVAWLNNA